MWRSRIVPRLVALQSLIGLFALLLPGPRPALGAQGVGVLTGAPLVFGAHLASSAGNFVVFAYHADGPSDSNTRVIVKTTSQFGVVPVDDEWADEDALQLSSEGGVWTVTLEVLLPTYGDIDLTLTSPIGFYLSGINCGEHFDVESRSGGLSDWGQVSGHIGAGVDLQTRCLAWGSDVYGYVALHPVGI